MTMFALFIVVVLAILVASSLAIAVTAETRGMRLLPLVLIVIAAICLFVWLNSPAPTL